MTVLCNCFSIWHTIQLHSFFRLQLNAILCGCCSASYSLQHYRISTLATSSILNKPDHLALIPWLLCIMPLLPEIAMMPAYYVEAVHFVIVKSLFILNLCRQQSMMYSMCAMQSCFLACRRSRKPVWKQRLSAVVPRCDMQGAVIETQLLVFSSDFSRLKDKLTITESQTSQAPVPHAEGDVPGSSVGLVRDLVPICC